MQIDLIQSLIVSRLKSSDYLQICVIFFNEKWLDCGLRFARVKHHFSFNANQLILNKFYIVDEYY